MAQLQRPRHGAGCCLAAALALGLAVLAPAGVRWATPDLDQDGKVDVCDLMILLPAWGPCADRCCAADIDRDGEVGVTDLTELVRWWGVYRPDSYEWCR